jgi:hypothetical protein
MTDFIDSLPRLMEGRNEIGIFAKRSLCRFLPPRSFILQIATEFAAHRGVRQAVFWQINISLRFQRFMFAAQFHRIYNPITRKIIFV